MKLLYTSVIAVLLIAALPLAPAKPTDLRVPYKGAAPFGAGAFEDECALRPGLSMGVVCVAIPKGSTEMTFGVDDASDLAVGGSYYLYDAAGEVVGAGAYCGGASTSVPAGGYAVVRIELVNGPLVCADEGIVGGEGTRGYVSFAIR